MLVQRVAALFPALLIGRELSQLQKRDIISHCSSLPEFKDSTRRQIQYFIRSARKNVVIDPNDAESLYAVQRAQHKDFNKICTAMLESEQQIDPNVRRVLRGFLQLHCDLPNELAKGQKNAAFLNKLEALHKTIVESC